jgi:hypothetical protein
MRFILKNSSWFYVIGVHLNETVTYPRSVWSGRPDMSKTPKKKDVLWRYEVGHDFASNTEAKRELRKLTSLFWKSSKTKKTLRRRRIGGRRIRRIW